MEMTADTLRLGQDPRKTSRTQNPVLTFLLFAVRGLSIAGAYRVPSRDDFRGSRVRFVSVLGLVVGELL